jgi:hypothetical protein
MGDASPVAIVLDTLNRSLNGSESSDEDMAAYIRAADKIRETFDCAVIIVHHCGIDATRPRGHTSQTGAADVQLSVKREGDVFVMTVELAKDGPQGDTIISRLQEVEVGIDEDGDPITSCVVMPVNQEEMPPSAPARKLSARQRLALDALNECTIGAGMPAPAGLELPRNTRVVPIDIWRSEMLTRRVIDPESKNRRQDLRLHEQLQAKRLIGIKDNLVWLAI